VNNFTVSPAWERSIRTR